MYNIIAAHCDDELIGCFDYIISNQIDNVYIFFDKDEHRKQESIKLANDYNYKVHFIELGDIKNLPNSENYLVHNSYDNHKDHLILNKYSKKYLKNPEKENLLFYSIDMNKNPAKETSSSLKKELLEKYFPSQKVLLKDEKYFLFKDISSKDCYQEISFTINSYMTWEISIETFSNDEIEMYSFKDLIVKIVGDTKYMLVKESLETIIDTMYYDVIQQVQLDGIRAFKVQITQDDFKVTKEFKI